MDPILLAGLVGAGGSIVGALGGTALGYSLSNSKSAVDVYLDNKVWLYYFEATFSMYIPITVINEGAKSSTITKFEAILVSPTKQKWTLYWEDFAEENSHKGEGWVRGKSASPILVHGKSGKQHHLRFVSLGSTSKALSDVVLSSGEYELVFSSFDRSSKNFNTKSYTFNIETEPQQLLEKRRVNKADLTTWWFPIRDSANQKIQTR